MGTTRYHAELSLINETGDQKIIYPKSTISDVYTDSKSGIDIGSKISYYGVCLSSFADTVKKVTIPGFVLKNGVHVTIKFASTEYGEYISTNDPGWKLQINSLNAYAINFKFPTYKEKVLKISADYILNVVFDEGSNSFIQIENSTLVCQWEFPNTNNDTFHVMLSPESNGTYIKSVAKSPNLYVKSQTFYAPYFCGDGSKLTNLNAGNISSGTINNERLATISGLNAASYGPSLSVGLAHGTKFYVPYITVNAKGLVTAIKNTELTLPSTYEGNATTATRLQTARNITIGNTTRSFDGTSNVSWSLSEIGAAAASHTHSYLPLSGGSVSGDIIPDATRRRNLGGESYAWASIYGYYVYCTDTIYEGGTALSSKYAAASHTHSYLPLSGGTLTGALMMKPSSGSGNIQLYYNGGVTGMISGVEGGLNIIPIYTGYGYVGTADYKFKAMYATTFNGSLSGNATSATKLETARTLTIGNTGKSFNGTSNVSWSLSDIGAAAASHTHSYLPLSGGSVSGDIIPDATRRRNLGGESYAWASIYGYYVYCTDTIYEGGTALSSKYAAASHTHNSVSASGYALTMTTAGNLEPTGTVYIGTSTNPIPQIYTKTIYASSRIGSSSNPIPQICADTIFEDGTTLSNKYVPINTAYTKVVSGVNYVTIQGNGSGYSTGGLKVTVYGTADGGIASTYGEITGTGDNTCNLGQYHTRWQNVYAASGTVNTSDKNFKTDIRSISDKYKQLLLSITPSTFKFKDGTSGRTHTGFISQEVEDIMSLCDLTDMDFAGFCKDAMTEEKLNEDGTISRVPIYDDNGEQKYIYSLRYTEFIPIIAAVVQDLYKEIELLKSNE